MFGQKRLDESQTLPANSGRLFLEEVLEFVPPEGFRGRYRLPGKGYRSFSSPDEAKTLLQDLAAGFRARPDQSRLSRFYLLHSSGDATTHDLRLRTWHVPRGKDASSEQGLDARLSFATPRLEPYDLRWDEGVADLYVFPLLMSELRESEQVGVRVFDRFSTDFVSGQVTPCREFVPFTKGSPHDVAAILERKLCDFYEDHPGGRVGYEHWLRLRGPRAEHVHLVTIPLFHEPAPKDGPVHWTREVELSYEASSYQGSMYPLIHHLDLSLRPDELELRRKLDDIGKSR